MMGLIEKSKEKIYCIFSLFKNIIFYLVYFNSHYQFSLHSMKSLRSCRRHLLLLQVIQLV